MFSFNSHYRGRLPHFIVSLLTSWVWHQHLFSWYCCAEINVELYVMICYCDWDWQGGGTLQPVLCPRNHENIFFWSFFRRLKTLLILSPNLQWCDLCAIFTRLLSIRSQQSRDELWGLVVIINNVALFVELPLIAEEVTATLYVWRGGKMCCQNLCQSCPLADWSSM